MKKILTLLFLLTVSITVLADTNQFLSTQGGTYKRITSAADVKDGSIVIIASHSVQNSTDEVRIMTTASTTYSNKYFGFYTYEAYSDEMPETITLSTVNTDMGDTEHHYPYEYCQNAKNSYYTLQDINNKYMSYSTTGTNHAPVNHSLSLINTYSNYEQLWGLFENSYVTRYNSRPISCINYSDESNAYFSNISGQNNSTIYKKIHSLTIGSTGYATLYYEHNDLVLPAGLTAFTYDLEDGKLARKNITKGNADGTVRIPHGTAVMIKGEPGTYELDILAKNVATGFTGNNLLSGTDTQATTTSEEPCLFYFLANGSNGLGFYYGAADGAAFLNNAHKAYLCIPTGSSTKITFLSLEDDNTTGAHELNSNAPSATTKCYDLSGRQITEPSRGLLYIKGGKKYSR